MFKNFFNYNTVREGGRGMYSTPNIPKIAAHSISLVMLLFVGLIFWPATSVPTGTRGVLTQFGAIKAIEPEGLVIVAPWQSVTLFSIRAEQADIEKATGSTNDTQPVDTSLTVRYSILPDKVSEVYEKYSHNGDLSNYVQTATQEAFKSVTAKYSATDLIAKRALVSADINIALSAKLEKYGAQVISIDMRNFEFSKSYMEAINDKVTQEQKALAAVNTVKTAEAQQRIKLVTAEADAAALKATADGQYYFITRGAEAQAHALEVQNTALAKNKDVLELRKIEVSGAFANKWNGVLPVNIYGSAPIPFLQTEK